MFLYKTCIPRFGDDDVVDEGDAEGVIELEQFRRGGGGTAHRDPDAVEGVFIHWLVWNIDPKTGHIEVDSVPKGAVQGMTTNKKNHYVPPCPPSGTHRYQFKLYALDQVLNLSSGSTKQDLENAISGHIVQEAKLVGKYSRQK